MKNSSQKRTQLITFTLILVATASFFFVAGCGEGSRGTNEETATRTSQSSGAPVLSGVTDENGRERCAWYTAEEDGELAMAICKNDLEGATRLIDTQKLDVNAKNARGITPLEVASRSSTVYWQHGFRPKMVKMLLDRGANANILFSTGETALTLAALFCEEEIVKLLVEGGADVNFLNVAKHSAIYMAEGRDFRLCHGDADRIISYLKSKGAN
jgi:hypothetical protein